jgi:hypothetical protein
MELGIKGWLMLMICDSTLWFGMRIAEGDTQTKEWSSKAKKKGVILCNVGQKE